MSLIYYLGVLFITLFFCYIFKINRKPMQFKLSFINGKITYDKKIIYFVLIFIPMWVLIAFRNISVGTDTGITYYRIFQHSLNGSYQIYADNAEAGYLLFNNLVAGITDNFFAIIFITGTISWLIFYVYIIKNSEDIGMSILIFFLSYNYFHMFNGIRQFISIGIVLLAFKFIYSKKFIPYIIFIMIASTFHIMALVYIPLYFLYNIKCDIKKSTVILSLSTFFFPIFWNFFSKFMKSEKLLYYLKTRKYYHSVTISFVVISFVILGLGLLIQFILKLNDKVYSLNLWMQLFSLIIAINAPYIPEHNRVYWLFSINSMIFVPMIANKIKKYKIIIYTAVIIVFTADFVRSYFTGMDQIQNYSFWSAIF